MDNFKNPISQIQFKNFWNRWHISLSTWFKDYLYIPLGGNRVITIRWIFNIVVTFLISGLWHGANWTFVVWGLLHGTYLAVYSLIKKYRALIPIPPITSIYGKFGSKLLTFFLVVIAWVFFRAPTMRDALYIAKQSLYGIGTVMYSVSECSDAK